MPNTAASEDADSSKIRSTETLKRTNIKPVDKTSLALKVSFNAELVFCGHSMGSTTFYRPIWS